MNASTITTTSNIVVMIIIHQHFTSSIMYTHFNELSVISKFVSLYADIDRIFESSAVTDFSIRSYILLLNLLLSQLWKHLSI